MDASRLVIREDVIRTKDLNDLINILHRSHSELLGCIYNDASKVSAERDIQSGRYRRGPGRQPRQQKLNPKENIVMSKYDESQIQEDEVVIDLGVLFSDMWRGFKKYWLPIVLIVLICTIGSMTLTMFFYTPMYRAEATFTVTPSSNANYDDYTYNYNSSTASLMANTFPYIIESSLLQDIIKEDLGVDEIQADITAEAVENANMFSLTVTSQDGAWSYEVLMSVMENYPQVARYVIGDSTMNLLAEPSVPEEPYNATSYLRNGGIGFVAGILVCGGILFYLCR